MLLLLSLSPVHISRARLPYPRHWKSNQQIPLQPKTLGEEIKKHRLELHWLQADVAAKIGISSTSVSNWERGITSPSRRMTKNLRAFLDYIPPAMDSRKQTPYPRCSRCGISETCPNVVYLRGFVSNSLKAACIHKFMQLTAMVRARDVAFLRPRCERPSEGHSTRLDSQLSCFKATPDYWTTLEKETI